MSDNFIGLKNSRICLTILKGREQLNTKLKIVERLSRDTKNKFVTLIQVYVDYSIPL